SKHLEFYTHTVTFLVEDCLFRTPREPLEAESTVFRDRFLLPQGESKRVYGRSPVVLRGVSKKEFESLLRALMYRSVRHGTNKGSDLDYDQWMSVLKLSTTWEFTGLSNAAIEYLDCLLRPLDPITKVELALQYNIQEWLLSALLMLARRSAPISIEEGRRIGFENALKLASVREKLQLETTVEEFSY
ncbi:hypothetical protein M404DRAFT_48882, partial [Pisolithus tinctorius Marx 270]